MYDKLWAELSHKDKQVLYAIAESDDGKVLTIRNTLHMENNQFTPYRKRLIQKGLLDGSTYGYLRFTLPLFGEYVKSIFE